MQLKNLIFALVSELRRWRKGFIRTVDYSISRLHIVQSGLLSVHAKFSIKYTLYSCALIQWPVVVLKVSVLLSG